MILSRRFVLHYARDNAQDNKGRAFTCAQTRLAWTGAKTLQGACVGTNISHTHTHTRSCSLRHTMHQWGMCSRRNPGLSEKKINCFNVINMDVKSVTVLFNKVTTPLHSVASVSVVCGPCDAHLTFFLCCGN